MKENQKKGTKLTPDTISKSLLDSYQGKNLIFEVACVVENLDAETALKKAIDCSDLRGFVVFYMGGILNIIRQQKYYQSQGYKSFKEYLGSIGLNRSTANDWMAVYVNLVESDVPWESIGHIGWTKIRLFARCLTKDNWQQWIEIAEGRSATELRKYVAAEKLKAASLEKAKGNPFVESNLSTHEDISNGTGETECQPDSVDSATQSKSVKPLVTPEVAVTVKQTYSFLLALDQQETVEEALALAMAESETDFKSVALTNICMHFLATF